MLEKIQSSLLVFCLDDDSPHATPEDYSQVFSYLVQLFLSLFFFLKNLFIFGCAGSLLLCMGFLSSCGRRGVFSSCWAWASHCSGFSLGGTGWRCMGFSSYHLRARPLSPVLAGGFLTVRPPGKSLVFFLPTDFSGELLCKLNMRRILLHAGFFF